MSKFILFGVLLLVHLLYDFHWQTDFIALNKGKRPFILIVHCLTWALFVWLTGYFLAGFALWKFVFLFVTHLASDVWKSRQPKTEVNFYQIYIDQGIHFLSLVVVTLV